MLLTLHQPNLPPKKVTSKSDYPMYSNQSSQLNKPTSFLNPYHMLTRLVIGFVALMTVSHAQTVPVTGNIPYAADLKKQDGTLKVWTIDKIREDKYEAVNPIEGEATIMDRDNNSRGERLGDRSNMPNESKTYEGTLDLTSAFLPATIAILVDDIAILTIKEIPTGNEPAGHTPFTETYKVNGTALWNPKSYKEFRIPLPPGRKYQLDLVYTNNANLTAKYTDGKVDIDGVSVYVSLLPVEITPKGSADPDFTNPKDCWDHEKDWFDFQGVTSKSPGEGEPNRIKIEAKFVSGGLPQGLKLKWTLEAGAGTLENADTITPKHLPPEQPGQGKLTLEILDKDNNPIVAKIDRVLKIYEDHLERNRENFGVGTFCGTVDWKFNRFDVDVTMKEAWNCHGSIVHSYDGTGGRFISAADGLPQEMAVWPKIGSVTIAENEKYGFDDQGNSGTDVNPGHFRAKFQNAGVTLKHGDVLIYRRPNNTIDHSQMIRTGSNTYGANNTNPQSADNGAWDWAEMEAGLYYKSSRSVDNDGDPIAPEDNVFPATIDIRRPPRNE